MPSIGTPAQPRAADPGTGYRVLLVDDEQEFLALAKEQLEADPRLKVVGTVTSGERALELASELRPDVVLVDAYLRGITGFEAARRLRGELPGARVAVLSADAEPGYGPLAAAYGAHGFLPKVDLSANKVLSLLPDSAG